MINVYGLSTKGYYGSSPKVIFYPVWPETERIRTRMGTIHLALKELTKVN